ncbi:hypothetical protein DOPI104051_02265 [Dolosigranulum pigrum]|uniref:Lipoprotein n=1 Tax=Dolosigranulum pigrum ATCC 51524 TaxID=883103 RepID=H3NER8_9LACT|nr:hypothetical protein [Dolosigranulum pigrum]EHR32933.1 hypothetical protein HMPREF9703_01049 [Dolosigranulum pigrum ATCC 51524]
MKNIKKLLGVLAIALLVLVGCGNGMKQRVDKYEEETQQLLDNVDNYLENNNYDTLTTISEEKTAEGMEILEEIGKDVPSEEMGRLFADSAYRDEVFNEKDSELFTRTYNSMSSVMNIEFAIIADKSNKFIENSQRLRNSDFLERIKGSNNN